VQRAQAGSSAGTNDFASAAVTDRVISMISEDAVREDSRLTAEAASDLAVQAAPKGRIAAALTALRGGK
jgi:hypothetical protein